MSTSGTQGFSGEGRPSNIPSPPPAAPEIHQRTFNEHGPRSGGFTFKARVKTGHTPVPTEQRKIHFHVATAELFKKNLRNLNQLAWEKRGNPRAGPSRRIKAHQSPPNPSAPAPTMNEKGTVARRRSLASPQSRFPRSRTRTGYSFGQKRLKIAKAVGPGEPGSDVCTPTPSAGAPGAGAAMTRRRPGSRGGCGLGRGQAAEPRGSIARRSRGLALRLQITPPQ